MPSEGRQPCRPLRSVEQEQPQSQVPPLAQEQVLEQPQPQGQVTGWVRGVEQVQVMVILLVGNGLRIASGASAPPTTQPCTLPSSGESREPWAVNRPSGRWMCSPGVTPEPSAAYQGSWRPSVSGCGKRVGRSSRSASQTLMID